MTIAQILILGDSDAKLDKSPIKSRCPKIDAKRSSYLGKPVSGLTKAVEVLDPTKPAISNRWRIER